MMGEGCQGYFRVNKGVGPFLDSVRFLKMIFLSVYEGNFLREGERGIISRIKMYG